MRVSKIGKIGMVVLAVVAGLALLVVMPFSSGVRDWIGDKVGKTGDAVKAIAGSVLITACAGLMGFVAVGIAAALPIVAVVLAVVAVAAIVYAWYPVIFEGDTGPGNTTITREVDNEDDD